MSTRHRRSIPVILTSWLNEKKSIEKVYFSKVYIFFTLCNCDFTLCNCDFQKSILFIFRARVWKVYFFNPSKVYIKSLHPTYTYTSLLSSRVVGWCVRGVFHFFFVFFDVLPLLLTFPSEAFENVYFSFVEQPSQKVTPWQKYTFWKVYFLCRLFFVEDGCNRT